jgi:putative ribosome biogenesis GTPase RsgA
MEARAMVVMVVLDESFQIFPLLEFLVFLAEAVLEELIMIMKVARVDQVVVVAMAALQPLILAVVALEEDGVLRLVRVVQE